MRLPSLSYLAAYPRRGDPGSGDAALDRRLAGTYEWRSAASGAFLDIATIELRADGTYDAKVEATLVHAGVRSSRFPCTLAEAGGWTAYDVEGETKLRLRPTTNRARVYGASLEGGALTLTRRGAKTVLFMQALVTLAS